MGEHSDHREQKLAQIAGIFSRPQESKASSRSASPSESSDDAATAPFREHRRPPRQLTEEDAPYQELFAAAQKGDLETVNKVLASGDVEDLSWRQPEDGNTALH